MTGIKDHGAFYPNKVRIEANPRSGPNSGEVGVDL
jgi:uncharacterized protein (DUF427 family)